MVASAQATTVQTFLAEVGGQAQAAALSIALTTEALRSVKVGDSQKAACISDNLITRADYNAPGFGLLVKSLDQSKDPSAEPVEVYIVSALSQFCKNSSPSQHSNSEAVPKSAFMPINAFFSLFPNTKDKVDIVSLAMSTQALRATAAGNMDYGKCIMSNLVIGPDRKTPAGFREFARQLSADKTATTFIEQAIGDAITANCGDEPNVLPRNKQ